MIDYGLLGWMQFAIGSFERFDRNNRLAMDHRQKLNAGIDRAIVDRAILEFTDDNCTGAAVAFRTTLLWCRLTALVRRR